MDTTAAVFRTPLRRRVINLGPCSREREPRACDSFFSLPNPDSDSAAHFLSVRMVLHARLRDRRLLRAGRWQLRIIQRLWLGIDRTGDRWRRRFWCWLLRIANFMRGDQRLRGGVLERFGGIHGLISRCGVLTIAYGTPT